MLLYDHILFMWSKSQLDHRSDNIFMLSDRMKNSQTMSDGLMANSHAGNGVQSNSNMQAPALCVLPVVFTTLLHCN